MGGRRDVDLGGDLAVVPLLVVMIGKMSKKKS